MGITIQSYGGHSPGLESSTVSSPPTDPSTISVVSLSSTQVVFSVLNSGQTINVIETGTFDLSSLGGSIPKTAADLSADNIPCSIATLTVGAGGQNFFTISYSPATSLSHSLDVLSGGPTMVAALSGNDVFIGDSTVTGNNNDSVYLYGGNDTYYETHSLLTNRDLFIGGDGVDTAVMPGKAANYTITAINTVWDVATQKSDLPGYTITDNTKAINTLDVNTVERLQFTDTNVALDIGPTQTAGSVYMLYQATFNRTPDAAGLGYWIAQVDKGANIITTVAATFVTSPEFVAKYGSNPSNASYVDNLYQNVLHRAGESGGVAYWNGQLNTGAATKAFVLEQFATLAEGAALVAPAISHGIAYQQWVG